MLNRLPSFLLVLLHLLSGGAKLNRHRSCCPRCCRTREARWEPSIPRAVYHVHFSVTLFTDKSKKRREANSDGNLLCLALCITNQLEELRESVGGENVGGLIFLPHSRRRVSLKKRRRRVLREDRDRALDYSSETCYVGG
jgi:hypothetical protein